MSYKYKVKSLILAKIHVGHLHVHLQVATHQYVQCTIYNLPKCCEDICKFATHNEGMSENAYPMSRGRVRVGGGELGGGGEGMLLNQTRTSGMRQIQCIQLLKCL